MIYWVAILTEACIFAIMALGLQRGVGDVR